MTITKNILQDKFIRRVIIEGVSPEIDCGRFPAKRVIGERVLVQADIFSDSHDVISGVLMYRKREETLWKKLKLRFFINDRWYASFIIKEIGQYIYTLCAWIDEFKTWRRDLEKKAAANQDISVEFLVGAGLLENTAKRALNSDTEWLQKQAKELRSEKSKKEKIIIATDTQLLKMMQKYPDKKKATFYDKELVVIAERKKALFSSWYEMFPRSCSPDGKIHGTFEDCKKRLPYIASMGFDVLYLPPVHPIGRTHRKGKNNSPNSLPGDPGSPWAIGSHAGGHKSIHPRLGTLDDFKSLRDNAQKYGIEIAMDMAFQCSFDHPYVNKHPEWFRKLPDGNIRYAENPPKKYEDIYPLDFESENCQELIQELKDVVLFWIKQGIRIFRVDNPHTKPFEFWEWLISSVKSEYPETIFLAEAFTRPKVMYRLAKLGFSQSYTYFTWRNTAYEIQKYFLELNRSKAREFFRPNLWPNTPDILPEYLQTGKKPAFIIRLVLAATLGASYGIYGPAFELCLDQPREAGSEEYDNSEKYEIKHWDIGSSGSLKYLIARINRIRNNNEALQNNRSLTFHPVDNEKIICYTKHTEDLSNIVLITVNLDPHHTHNGWVNLPLSKFKIDGKKSFQMHDLLSEARYIWNGEQNFIELNPGIMPAHIFVIRRKVKTEQDFDYYL